MALNRPMEVDIRVRQVLDADRRSLALSNARIWRNGLFFFMSVGVFCVYFAGPHSRLGWVMAFLYAMAVCALLGVVIGEEWQRSR